MIRPLRKLHRRYVIAIGVFLPVVFVVGIAARKPMLEIDKTTTPSGEKSSAFPVQEWARRDLFGKVKGEVDLLRERKESGRFAIRFLPPAEFLKPDLLVYWAPGNITATNGLPANAILLGAFDMELPLPRDLSKPDGVLMLYSLADNEVVDVSINLLHPFSKTGIQDER